MLPRHLGELGDNSSSWQELGNGAPTIVALAKICARALEVEPEIEPAFSVEAKTLLFAAKNRGVMEIVGTNTAFDAVDRFLAVSIEVESDRRLTFKRNTDPERTVRFLDAFKELCESGLVLHHLFREFSLSSNGFKAAKTVREEEVQKELKFGVSDQE